MPEERRLGIAAGFAWGTRADLVAFYLHRGWSSGMRAALEHRRGVGLAVEHRRPRGAIERPPVVRV